MAAPRLAAQNFVSLCKTEKIKIPPNNASPRFGSHPHRSPELRRSNPYQAPAMLENSLTNARAPPPLTFIAPSHLSRGDQAVTAHTSSVPAPPYPIRAEGPDLWYQMRLEDTMVGLSLAPKSRGARIRECVYVGLVGGGVGGWGWGGWLCGPVVHVPLGGSTEGARPSWRPTRHQDGSDSVTILPVAERVVRAIVAAPMASPAPVTIGSRCPAQPVDYRTGQSVV
jgi:hypothetical protein